MELPASLKDAKRWGFGGDERGRGRGRGRSRGGDNISIRSEIRFLRGFRLGISWVHLQHMVGEFDDFGAHLISSSGVLDLRIVFIVLQKLFHGL